MRMGAERIYDLGWSDEMKCRGCNKEKGHREAQTVPLPGLG